MRFKTSYIFKECKDTTIEYKGLNLSVFKRYGFWIKKSPHRRTC